MKRYLAFAFLICALGLFGLQLYATDETTNPMPVRSLIPELDDTFDIGNTEREIRNVYIDGTAYIDTAEITALTPTTLTLGSQSSTAFNKAIGFNVMDFSLDDGIEITAATAPGLEEDNVAPAIVWADGETTPVMVPFRVPADYTSGGAFRVCLDGSGTSTKNQVDFDVYVTTPGAAWDSSATNQTPVARTEASGSPEMVALTVATDFASLAAGDIVVLRLWRDDVADGTDDMELFYAEFYYN